MALWQRNKLAGIAVVLLLGAFPLQAQETDSTHYVLHDFRRFESLVGLETGADISESGTAYHFGLSYATMERSCVLGQVSSGSSAGIVFMPERNICGVYVQRWLTLAIIDFGLKAGYETNLRSQWAVIQPQVGLGFGLFRITYNYTAPIFIDEKAPVPRHNLGIAYTLPWGRIGS